VSGPALSLRSENAATRLRAVKTFHTLVWAFFATCVLAIPVSALAGRTRVALVMAGLVFVEVAVLAVNGGRCPLTAVAARYTDDRRDNFDIYLPLWLARYNKLIFGTLFVVGLLLLGYTLWFV
jgi:hypothetical protein